MQLATTQECSWGVLQTKANSERVALMHLKRQGFNIYLPKYINVRGAVRPLFPRYLFVEQPEHNWRTFFTTQGIVGAVIGTAGAFAVVSEKIINAIRSREDVRGVVYDERPDDGIVHSHFSIGDVIRQKDGVFDKEIGTIVELKPNDRIVALFEIFGRKVKIESSASDLELG